MVQRTRMWVFAAVFAAGLTATGRADEVSELRKQVENQYNELLKVQTKLVELEAAQKTQGESVKQLEASGGYTLPDTLKWVEKVKLYGDFRYRHEQIDGDNVNQRDRHRIRARVGLKGQINDDWAFDLRLASGNDDSPISTNQDLDGGFSSKDIWLDRAFLTYTSPDVAGLSVRAGKMGNPFLAVGGNQLIWDGDLAPEGIAVKYTTALTDATSLFVNAAGFWVEERGSDTDTGLWGIQSGLTHAFEDKSKLTGGASYFKYSNIEGKAAIGAFAGNSSQGGVYSHDYELAELFGEYATKMGKTPIAFYGDYVVNTASGVSGDTGWLVGTKLGKARDPGTWEVGYEYRELERDAVLAAFTDSDFINGGTNGRGHKFSFKYALAKNVAAGVTYFLNQRDADNDGQLDDKYRRLQLDVEVKF